MARNEMTITPARGWYALGYALSKIGLHGLAAHAFARAINQSPQLKAWRRARGL